MNLQQQFDEIKEFYDRALGVIANRQSDYAPDGVALLNVLDSCVRWGQTPYQVLGNLLDKQMTALQHLCQHGHVNSDPPVSRLCDAANYFAFFHMFIINEQRIYRAWYDHWVAIACECPDGYVPPAGRCKRCRSLQWICDHATQS